MFKRLYLSLILVALCCGALADIPEGYYIAIDGAKGLTLKRFLHSTISNHRTLGYNSLWQHYPRTYYHLDDPKRVWDMYSSKVTYYNTSGEAVSGMNKEHTVPKSWWGGSTSAQPGNDLYNVIPSDQDANSRKSNYPLGVVKTQSWTNGVTTVGYGNVDGSSKMVFEPTDEYKGDFARIYFYMATCYPTIWESGADAMSSSDERTLKAWIIPMLLQWNEQDPVCPTEVQHNEDIYGIQQNRNPFIDFPELAEYIWGNKTDEVFVLSEHSPNTGDTNHFTAHTPKFDLDGGTESKPKEVAVGTQITIKALAADAELHVRVNDDNWITTTHTVAYYGEQEVIEGAQQTITLTSDTKIEAYCTQTGYEDSPVITYYYKVVDFSGEYLLYEAFDEVSAGNNTSNTGSSPTWPGNANFPTVTNAFAAGNAIKLGSGKATGSITSRTLLTGGGTVSVSLKVKGWTNIEGDLKVTLGSESKTVSYTAVMEDDEFETVNLTFNQVPANPTLTISTTTKRAFVDDIRVQMAEDPSGIDSPAVSTRTSCPTYNISGQSVTRLYHGVVIENGKKVLK